MRTMVVAMTLLGLAQGTRWVREAVAPESDLLFVAAGVAFCVLLHVVSGVVVVLTLDANRKRE